MKRILPLLAVVLSTTFLSSCKKSETNDVTPSSDFVIKNINAEVNEGASLVVVNNSQSCGDVTYKWDFGNGKTSTEKTPVISYGMHGEYNVTLTVTDSKGRVSTTTKPITVLCIFATINHPALF